MVGQDMLPRPREQYRKIIESENSESFYVSLSPDPDHLPQESSQSINSTCFTTASLGMSFDESSSLHDSSFSNVDSGIPKTIGKHQSENFDLLDSMDKPQRSDQSNVFTNPVVTNSSNTLTDIHNMDSPVASLETRPYKPNLMTLLSGKQKTKKPKPKLRANDDMEREQNSQQIEAEEIGADKSGKFIPNECIDDSFTDSKSNDLRKEHEMIELEKKFYKDSVKSVTAKDFLALLGQKRLVDKLEDETNVDEPLPIFINEMDKNEPVLIEVDSDENKDDIELLESKMFGRNLKKTSARDIFLSFKPTPALQNKSKQRTANNIKRSYIVSLEVNPEHLKEIHKTNNPLFTKGNNQMTPSLIGAKSFLDIMQNSSTKNKRIITLRVDSNRLRDATRSLGHPLFSRGIRGIKDKSTDKFFKSMMKNTSANLPKLSSLQKLKELHPPSLSRDLFHIYVPNDIQKNNDQRCLTLVLKPEQSYYLNIDQNIKEEDRSMILNITQIKARPHLYKVELKRYPTKEKFLESVFSIIPLIQLSAPLMKVYSRFLETSIDYRNKESLLWTNLFQPQRMTDVLISSTKQKDIKTWVLNSFARLKSQTLKTPRNVLIKQQKRQKKTDYGGLNDFIVDDYGGYLQDGSETEEDIFVPLLILQGSVGSCKSSAVYAAINEINGYVYEINSGQPRGKKDILGTLKEMCTTHLVHRQNEDKEFQKGIVLLEDCDVLFEQDKNFWLAVQEVLNISRRPVIITCNDLAAIPQSIIDFANDEDAVIHLDGNNDKNLSDLKDYLQLCCISQGYCIDGLVLEDILKECYTENYDLRKAFMACQMLCQNYPIHVTDETKDEIVIRKIMYNSKNEIKNEEFSLDEITNTIDLLSISDVISSNSHSLINHEITPNELLDIPFIDESTKLKQPTLPYELNIGNYITKSNLFDKPSLGDTLSFNRIREVTTNFTASRSKELPKFVQDLYSVRNIRTSTRSMTDSTESLNGWQRDITGISDSSICNVLSPSPYILELTPYARQWCHYQNSLDLVEEDTMKNLGVSVKKFIGWRQFQDNSRQILNTFI